MEQAVVGCFKNWVNGRNESHVIIAMLFHSLNVKSVLFCFLLLSRAIKSLKHCSDGEDLKVKTFF